VIPKREDNKKLFLPIITLGEARGVRQGLKKLRKHGGRSQCNGVKEKNIGKEEVIQQQSCGVNQMKGDAAGML